MKRLLSLTVALLAIAVGWAQETTHFSIDPPLPGGQSTETVVEAKLVTNATLSGNLSNYEIAALVDGKVRAIVFGNSNSYGAPGAEAADYNYFVFRIPGNFTTSEEDNGKAITFKMYNSTSGLEYDLSSPTITFDGERHGTTSELTELSVTEVTGLSITQLYRSTRININWDETYDIKDRIQLNPSGATPNNLNYTFTVPSYSADYIAVTADGIVSALQKPTNANNAWGLTVRLGNLSTTASVTVHNHVKNVTIKEGSDPIIVSINDAEGLKAALQQAFVIDPSGYTDYSNWSTSNSSIVGITYNPLTFTPKAVGDVRISQNFYYNAGDQLGMDISTGSGTVNVKVVQPVTAINLLHSLFDCNVGDDVTEFIKQCYEVAPTDATDKSVTYELDPTSNQGVVTIENNTIKAVGKGLAEIIVRSVSNPEVYATITARVGDYATSLAADRDSHTYTYIDSDINITGDIFGIIDPTTGLWTQIGMITAQPFGKDMYQLEVTSSDPSVVQVYPDSRSGQWYAFVKKAGTSTLTFNLSYPDFMAGTPGEPVIRAAEPVTLRIDVTQGPTAFSFNTNSITMNVGETINLKDYVTLQPEGASVADNDYIWTVQESDGQYMSVTGNTLQALAPNIDQKGSVLRLQLQGYESLGTADINVFIYQPATSITVNTREITVNKGDWRALRDALAAAVTVNPENHTDAVRWESDDPASIIYEEVADGEATVMAWNPIEQGECYMFFQVGSYNADGTFVTRLSRMILVTVLPIVESIEINATQPIRVEVGEDFMPALNKIINVLPEEAADRSWTVEGNAALYTIEDGKVIANAARRTPATLTIKSVSNPSVTATLLVIPSIQVKTLNVTEGDVYVKYDGSEVDISQQIASKIEFLPANASVINATIASDNTSVVSVSGTFATTNSTTAGWSLNNTYTAKALQPGTATVTVTLTYTDYLQDLIEPGVDHSTTVTKTFDVVVAQGLSGFEIASTLPNPMVVGQSYTLTLTPQPEDAEFDPNGFEAWINGGGGLEDFADIEHQDNGDGTYSITVTPNYPSIGNLVVNYADETTNLGSIVGDGVEINVGVPTTLTQGWQWKTLWGAIETSADFAAHLGDGTDNRYVDEVRSQSALMANDPVYGYYGELYDQGLQPGVAYKFNATTAVGIADAGIQLDGEILLKEKPQLLQKAWTWIGNPYVLSHAISAAIPTATDGDRIVSKEDGFAEYSGGKWTGTLTTLVPWQSYLYYNNSGAEKSFLWPAETDLPAASRSNSGVRFNAPRKVSPQSAWQYDASPFRDNMSMVAVVNEQWAMDNEQWTIGAFVDGECRGEGLCIDGRMFITVHANQGEEISFRLRNEVTGEQYPVDQTVRMQLMLGTLKAPYRLTSEGVATGVSNVQSTMNNVQESFDLGGRAVNATTTKGLTIRRGSDGKVRKVVK